LNFKCIFFSKYKISLLLDGTIVVTLPLDE
jgi:hypothetical protein